jgi:hypothetical protein
MLRGICMLCPWERSERGSAKMSKLKDDLRSGGECREEQDERGDGQGVEHPGCSASFGERPEPAVQVMTDEGR